MKLIEVLDLETMVDRINLLNKDKTKNTKTLVKLLRKKADQRNQKVAGTNKHQMRGAEDSFAGYMNNSFAQSNWGDIISSFHI